jgi:hypothetical protein
MALEKHHGISHYAEKWGLSPDTLRRMFESEPGVMVVERPRNRSSRRYRTLRIPESVATRLHRRLSNPDRGV